MSRSIFLNVDIFSTCTAKGVQGKRGGVDGRRRGRGVGRGRRGVLVGVGSVVNVLFSHNRTLTAVVMVFPGRVVPTVMEVTSSPTYEFLHHPTPIFPCDFKAFKASKFPIQNQWLPLKDTSFLDNFQSQVF